MAGVGVSFKVLPSPNLLWFQNWPKLSLTDPSQQKHHFLGKFHHCTAQPTKFQVNPKQSLDPSGIYFSTTSAGWYEASQLLISDNDRFGIYVAEGFEGGLCQGLQGNANGSWDVIIAAGAPHRLHCSQISCSATTFNDLFTCVGMISAAALFSCCN